MSPTPWTAQFKSAKKSGLSLLAIAAIASISLTGCSTSKNSQANGDAAGSGVLNVRGSDTMDKMIRAWTGAFARLHPQIRINVLSGDTGSGIKDLIDHKCNVAAASRELTEEEDSGAHKKGVHLSRTMVAKDAVAVIVGPKNPVNVLTLDELKGIFSGQMTKWAEIKSTPVPHGDTTILVLGREASSGTGDYLKEHILQGKPFGANVKLMPTSDAVINAVSNQKEAIGFVGMPQAERAGSKIKVVTLRLNASSPMEDKEDRLTGSDYPLSRPLYLYCDEAGGETAKSFVSFCLSKDGQKIAQDMGFMTLH